MPRTPSSLDTDPEPLGLAAQISRILSDAIINGAYRGGEQLGETELQKKFKISRSPLREAFRELEKKQLVTIQPRRGVFVREISLEDMKEHYTVQATLEGLAGREAAKHLRASDIKEMEDALAGMHRTAEVFDVASFRDYHDLFHVTYIKASRNGMLINFVSDLRVKGSRYRYRHKNTQEYCRERVSIHREILEMFKERRKPEEIQEAIRKHIEDLVDWSGWEL
jgi:DNA-binding GntR family transcriptional regulator